MKGRRFDPHGFQLFRGDSADVVPLRTQLARGAFYFDNVRVRRLARTRLGYLEGSRKVKTVRGSERRIRRNASEKEREKERERVIASYLLFEERDLFLQRINDVLMFGHLLKDVDELFFGGRGRRRANHRLKLAHQRGDIT